MVRKQPLVHALLNHNPHYVPLCTPPALQRSTENANGRFTPKMHGKIRVAQALYRSDKAKT